MVEWTAEVQSLLGLAAALHHPEDDEMIEGEGQKWGKKDGHKLGIFNHKQIK